MAEKLALFFHYFTEKMKKSLYDLMVEARKDRERIKHELASLKNAVLEAREYSKTAAKETMAKDMEDQDRHTLNLPWRYIEEIEEAMEDDTVREAFKRWLASKSDISGVRGHPARYIMTECVALPLRQQLYHVHPKG